MTLGRSLCVWKLRPQHSRLINSGTCRYHSAITPTSEYVQNLKFILENPWTDIVSFWSLPTITQKNSPTHVHIEGISA